MITIEKTVLKEVKEYLEDNVDYDLVIVNKALREPKKFPYILLEEYENNYRSRTVDGVESCSNLVYTVEIYSKDTANNTKENINCELEELVDKVLSKHFGMTRQSRQKLPNLDTDILRTALRYNCVMNDTRRRIY